MTGVRRTVELLAVSAATGGGVGAAVTAAAAALSGDAIGAAVGWGAPAGALIGLAACLAFLGLSLGAGRRPILSFVAVGPIIAAGTALASSAAGMPVGGRYLAVLGASVALGYAATLAWYRSYRRWNDRLRAYQDAAGHRSR